MRHLIGRFADDRPLPDRARLVAKMIAGGKKRFEGVAANLCEGGRLLAQPPPPSRRGGRGARAGHRTLGWQGGARRGRRRGDRPAAANRAGRARLGRRRTGPRRSRRRSRRFGAAAAAATTARSSTPSLADPEALVRIADAPDAWERVIEAEPAPVATISSAGVECIARAFGEFTDLKVGFLRGHSARVAELAAKGAAALGCSRGEISEVRAAGLPPRPRPGGGA